MTPLEAGLEYADRGWCVLPLNGKIPRCAGGVYDASSDPSEVRRWWTKWPGADIGIAMGGGIVVLDVDPRNGGTTSLDSLDEKHGFIRTLTARTGGGGLHLYLRGDLPSRAGFLAGLDLKGAGGYVVAPPSIHASGHRYEWVALDDLPTEPQSVPGWLQEMVRPRRPRGLRKRNRRSPTPRAPRLIVAAFEAEAMAVATASEGTRNTRLYDAAFSLARFVADGCADVHALVETLTIAAKHAGLPTQEVHRTLRSALAARGVAR